jgi:hypothetical protein
MQDLSVIDFDRTAQLPFLIESSFLANFDKRTNPTNDSLAKQATYIDVIDSANFIVTFYHLNVIFIHTQLIHQEIELNRDNSWDERSIKY